MGPNLFIFTFKDWKAARRILKRSLRYVMGHLLSLQYWVPEVAMYEIDFSIVPFWVQLHGLPLGTMTTKNAVKLTEQLGDIVEVENPLLEGKLLRSFMRVRINLDITQPISTGCWVPRKDLPKVWIA